MIRVKMYITLDVDPEDFPVPADENVGQEMQEFVEEYFYDLEGVTIKNIKTITE